jgi:predicted  nucleic acid-binding Zn-ribbon protein
MDIEGLAAIVFIFGPALFLPITWMVLRHRKEMLQMELEKRRLSNQEVEKQIEALRAEIAALRETSTQYDMSLQANLENLQERVRALEEQSRVQEFLR